MHSAEFAVPGAHCGSCRAEIERIVLGLPGVRSATVDLRSRSLTVGFDPEAVAASVTTDITQALRASGYEVQDTLTGDVGSEPA